MASRNPFAKRKQQNLIPDNPGPPDPPMVRARKEAMIHEAETHEAETVRKTLRNLESLQKTLADLNEHRELTREELRVTREATWTNPMLPSEYEWPKPYIGPTGISAPISTAASTAASTPASGATGPGLRPAPRTGGWSTGHTTASSGPMMTPVPLPEDGVPATSSIFPSRDTDLEVHDLTRDILGQALQLFRESRQAGVARIAKNAIAARPTMAYPTFLQDRILDICDPANIASDGTPWVVTPPTTAVVFGPLETVLKAYETWLNFVLLHPVSTGIGISDDTRRTFTQHNGDDSVPSPSEDYEIQITLVRKHANVNERTRRNYRRES